MRSAKALLLQSLKLLIGALDFLSMAVAFTLLAVPLLERWFPNKPGETYIATTVFRRVLYAPLSPWIELIHRRLPHEAGGFDLAPLMLAGFFFGFCFVCTKVLRQIRVDLLAMEEDERLAEAEQAARQAGVAERLQALQDRGAGERDKVLEVYATSKKLLEAQERDVSFLSIDVVGSTAMKQGEDPILAERDFRNYRKLVESILARHDALKAAWTPDGVMICFATLAGAVGAAQEVLGSLAEFNRAKSMRTDFTVRCGVNSGRVMIDDSVGMEEMSHASIDLAGHMQKYAEPGTIFAARDLAAFLGPRSGFVPVDKTVDGCPVAAWRLSNGGVAERSDRPR